MDSQPAHHPDSSEADAGRIIEAAVGVSGSTGDTRTGGRPRLEVGAAAVELLHPVVAVPHPDIAGAVNADTLREIEMAGGGNGSAGRNSAIRAAAGNRL